MLQAFLNQLRHIKHRFRRDPDAFLKHTAGILHIGANVGQERNQYHKYHVPVVWIEPIPEIFQLLCKNIATFPEQSAIQALVTDQEDQEYEFYLANNEGASSSILELAEHKKIWPEVTYSGSLVLRSTTLETLLNSQLSNCDDYALVLDTQGSELLILRGAKGTLKKFKYIKTEVADFESYKGCCQFDELAEYLKQQGFNLEQKDHFAGNDSIGNYYNALFCRT